jgi:hypothetical protein
MVIASRKSEVKGSSGLKKIRAESKVDEGRDVIVRYETGTLEGEGFKSFMALWNKVYERI